MRVKLLRGDDEATVLLVYPATIDEYTQALDAAGRAAGAAGASGTGSARRQADLHAVAAW